MSWSTTATLPERKTGASWTTSAALPAPKTGSGWFALLEKVVPLGGSGQLDATVDPNYPLARPRFTATGTLAATIAPVRTTTAVFSATAGLTGTRHQVQAVTVTFSASTDGLRVSVNDGLAAIITGGDSLIDGLSASVTGGSLDGLYATVAAPTGMAAFGGAGTLSATATPVAPVGTYPSATLYPSSTLYPTSS